ncbi:hypothetical protein C2845_PM09G16230 [Panicum miliaceum]|uniref:Uncharacterized protein n=1 Tax=Panicum miliaceum TaxID=4540 RepID=A0A3L6RX04_PANMI|nr:hypothetical protein C2845_PM09G16230 [Panicum miliaceum]
MCGSSGLTSVRVLCAGVSSDGAAPEAARARPGHPARRACPTAAHEGRPSWRNVSRSLTRTKCEAKTGSRGSRPKQGQRQHSSVTHSEALHFSDELTQRRRKNRLQSDQIGARTRMTETAGLWAAAARIRPAWWAL